MERNTKEEPRLKIRDLFPTRDLGLYDSISDGYFQGLQTAAQARAEVERVLKVPGFSTADVRQVVDESGARPHLSIGRFEGGGGLPHVLKLGMEQWGHTPDLSQATFLGSWSYEWGDETPTDGQGIELVDGRIGKAVKTFIRIGTFTVPDVKAVLNRGILLVVPGSVELEKEVRLTRGHLCVPNATEVRFVNGGKVYQSTTVIHTQF